MDGFLLSSCGGLHSGWSEDLELFFRSFFASRFGSDFGGFWVPAGTPKSTKKRLGGSKDALEGAPNKFCSGGASKIVPSGVNILFLVFSSEWSDTFGHIVAVIFLAIAFPPA